MNSYLIKFLNTNHDELVRADHFSEKGQFQIFWHRTNDDPNDDVEVFRAKTFNVSFVKLMSDVLAASPAGDMRRAAFFALGEKRTAI